VLSSQCCETTENPILLRLKVGDLVKKRTGYAYPGVIVSVFTTQAGAVRYVVEADHPEFAGMLHIFNADQLEPRA
jgi:hypothetical protein